MTRAMGMAAALIIGLGTGTVAADQLVYRPINPAFGGNPFNDDFLLSTAEIENQYADDGGGGLGSSDPIDEFATTLQRRLLSQLSSDITELIFGENAQDSGTIQVGSTTINFERVGNNVQISLRDDSTGSETTIILPVVGVTQF